MSKSPSRLVAAVASAAIAVSLSACTAGQWQYDAPPAAGVQEDLGGVKLRNVLILTDGSDAVLLGGIASRDEDTQVTGITYSPEQPDGTYGEPQELAFEVDIPKGQTVLIDGTDSSFPAEGLTVGRLADVTVNLADGGAVDMLVPVYSSEHSDFVEAWEQARA
ncbi:hypothetical protein [Tessaracoccus flavus]|jgi:hypothetical protein|uniref:Uncharacterized protein n=1 Tax=Tessaracoccus flavus TaxID=1610493 RepID=A0A1Q2CGR2_9ACTN|nr:hypothetical protein [Tessaracoccus flavus]AQP45309.1 hypothetical protein RPIT_11305 [Tessaracoccus flavus]SDY49312.1 hypothetical protein SAMN05428934_10242 [Tessaracoccus flavus]